MPLWSPSTCLLIEEAVLEQGKTTAWLARQCGIADSTIKGALGRRGAVSIEVHNRAMSVLGLESPTQPFDNDPNAKPESIQGPYTGPRCPNCNQPARPELFTSVRRENGEEKRYEVTRLHCPNNRKPVRGVAMKRGFTPCPIHQTERAI